MTKTTKTFAIVDSSSRIVSIHESRQAADSAGWGRDRELVVLIRAHEVGDVIDYSDRGEEI